MNKKKNRANVASALLTNTKDLEEAYKSALDAEGSAYAENEKYLDSIQGRIDQFTNAVQTMWNNTLDADVIKGFVQLGTLLIKLIDGPLGMLPSVLIAIPSVKFGSWLLKTTQESKTLADALKSLLLPMVKIGGGDGKTLGEFFTQTVDGFDDASNGARKFSNVLKATGKTIGKFFTTTAGKAALATVAITAVVVIARKMIVTLNDAKEYFTDTVDKLDETTNELNEAKQSLEDIKKRIDDIIKGGTLTFTDKEELERLKAQSAELQRQVDLKTELQKQQQQEVNEQALKMVEQHKNVVFDNGKSKGEYKETVATVGAIAAGTGVAIAGAIGGAKAAAAIGTAIGTTIAPGVGSAIGAALGAIVGAVGGALAGSAVGGTIADTKEQVGESIDDMRDKYAELQNDYNNARSAYMKNPGDKDAAEEYEKAEEALSKYKSAMSGYLSELDSYYSSIDLSVYDPVKDKEKIDELRQKINDFYDDQDKYAILSGGAGAKSNALARIFGENANEDIKAAKQEIETAMKSDGAENFDFFKLFDDDKFESFKSRLYDLGLSITDIEYYFKDLSVVEQEAAKAFDAYDTIKQLNVVSDGVGSLKDAFAEFDEQGLVTAKTLESLHENFGHLGDAWVNYINSMSSATTSTEQAERATKELAEAFVNDKISDGPIKDLKEYAILLTQLSSMGFANPKEYLDAKQKASMTSDIAKSVVGDEEWNGQLNDDVINQYIADYQKEYGITLDSTEDRLLVEKAITAEKAKQNVELATEKAGAAQALEIAKKRLEEEKGRIEYEYKPISEVGTNVSDVPNVDVWSYTDANGEHHQSFTGDEMVVVKVNNAEFIKSYEDAVEEAQTKYDSIEVPAGINIDNAEEEAQKAKDEYQRALDDQGLTIELELKNFDNDIDEIQSSYSTLSDVVKEYNKNKFLSLDNLQALLSLEPEYLVCLQMENGQLSINQAAMEAMVQAKLAEAKATVVQKAITELNTLAQRKEADATVDSANAAGNAIGNLGAYADTLGIVAQEAIVAAGSVAAFNSAVAGAEANELVSQEEIDTVLSNMETQLAMIDSVSTNLSSNFKRVMDPDRAEKDEDELIDKLKKKYERQLAMLDAQKQYLENEISRLEAENKPVSKSLYEEQIKIEEKKLKLYEQERKELLAQMNTVPKHSDDWWEMAEAVWDVEHAIQESTLSIVEMKDAITQLYIDAFDDVGGAHDNKLTFLDDQKQYIEDYMSYLETLGVEVPNRMYEKLIATEKQSIDQNYAKLADLQARFNEAKKNGAGAGENSEEWVRMSEEIRQVESDILASKAAMAEWNKELRDAEWGKFDELMERTEDVESEMDKLAGMFDDDKIANEDGTWTKEGVTQLGLLYQQMMSNESAAEEYSKKMEQLKEEYDAGKWSEAEYYEKLQELKDGQWDAIEATESQKEAIVDLHEARVDEIKNGIEKEIEAYEELIKVKRDELDAERDLHDFRNNIKDQTKDITTLERRIAAMSGSTDAATVAERTRLEAELREKRDSLNDIYYDHSMEAQSNALDEEQTAFEKSKNDYIEQLEQTLENTKFLIEGTMYDVLANADIVLNGINTKADEYGLELSPKLTSPWEKASEQAVEFKKTADLEIGALTNEEGVVCIFNCEANRLISEVFNSGKGLAGQFNTDVTDVLSSMYGEGGTVTLFNSNVISKFNATFGAGNTAATKFKNHVASQIDLIKADINSENPLLSKYIKQPWIDGQNAANTFSTQTGKVLDALVSKANTTANDIGKYADDIIADMRAAQRAIDETGGKDSGSGDVGSDGGNDTPSVTTVKASLTTNMGGNKITHQAIQTYGGNTGRSKADAYKEVQKSVKDQAYKRYKTKYDDAKLDKYYSQWDDKIKYEYYAKGTTGTKKDQWAITDEPQYGDELVLIPGKDGNLSYMRKGTSVIPADISENLMKLGMNPNFANMSNGIKGINIMTNYVNKPELKLDIENFLHVDNVSQDTMPELKKFVKEQVNSMVKQLNYGLKRN